MAYADIATKRVADRDYRARHHVQRAAYNRAWRAAHPEAVSTYNARYAPRNVVRKRALQAKRRTAQLRRTPAWANMERIAQIYVAAELASCEVDHVIPLQGKLVSGLHVHENLQILTRQANARKNNFFTSGG